MKQETGKRKRDRYKDEDTLGSLEISLANEQDILDIDHKQLERTIKYVLGSQSVRRANISLAVVDDTAIRALKESFFGLQETTDVISFNLGGENEEILDCEIVVNGACALREARRRGNTPSAELNLYVVHGLLHQLGYDDQTPEQYDEMHRMEDRLLEELGFGSVFKDRVE